MHQHVVARWAGDTNFVSVVGDIRILPNSVEAMYETLIIAMGL